LQTTTMFNDGRAAVTMGANGWLLDMRERGILPDIGIAPPPGPAYVGGSNLVIWRYTNRARVALELVRFLTSHQIQLDFCSQAGPLPVRLDVLDGPPYTTDPHYRVTVEALRTGRPYPSFVQWGLVEDRLSAAFIRLWDDILADPGQDLEVVIARHLKPVARRLAVIMTEAGGLS
jgi:ABC-type glycerol-3-phosphate transport system substrate-binding protein